MKKAFLAIVTALILVTALAACQAADSAAAASAPIPTAAETAAASPEVLTDTGAYVGQADSNFIEIKISGVPEENAAKTFMLTEKIKERFDALGLKEGDNIKVEYYTNADGQNVLVSIEKI